MENIKRICRFLENLLKNPVNVKFEDLDRLLKVLGYEVRQPGTGGSHYVYRKKGEKPITVPRNKRHVKQFYVKSIIKLLKLEEYYEENCKKRH